MQTRLNLIAAGLLLNASMLSAQTMPPGMTHEEHQRQMQKDAALAKNGERAMGFDQDAATHHFRLFHDGGAIEVDAKKSGDDATRSAIRAHLKEIADQFGAADFNKPFMTHGEEPPGVKDLTRLRASLRYQYEDTPAGGRVRISTADPEALSAVHAFLTYQIREHHTGDPTTVVRWP